MQVENVTRGGNKDTLLQFSGIPGSYGFTLQIGDDTTNCKLSYIHGVGNMGNPSEELCKQVIDNCLKYCKGYVIINSTNKNVATKITKLYPTYFYNEVPVGYYSGFQYVFAIKNTININTHCRQPVELKTLDKDTIKTKLLSILKLKKRKTDYIDEFINQL